MRLLNYLNEIYVDSFKSNWYEGTLDIYVNPTSKDISELKKVENRDRGFRVVADMNDEKVYITNNNAIHSDMFKALKLGVSGYDYYSKGFGANRYVTFSTASDNLKGILESDTFSSWEFGQANNNVIKNLSILYKKDFTWLNKWFNADDIKKMVERVLLKHTEKG